MKVPFFRIMAMHQWVIRSRLSTQHTVIKCLTWTFWPLKVKTKCFLEMSGSDNSLPKHHIPEQNLQLHRCVNVSFTIFTWYCCCNEVHIIKITVKTETHIFFFLIPAYPTGYINFQKFLISNLQHWVHLNTMLFFCKNSELETIWIQCTAH
jgi:hypothetical protein